MKDLAGRQSMTNLRGTAALNEFKRVNSEESNGAIFFAVSRGKLSEGLDFSDNDVRCVVVVGIPFRNISDPGVKIKIDFLNDICQETPFTPNEHLPSTKPNILRDGDTWYKMDAVKWLIQSMGRAHRHQNDYGAVVVLDSRLDNTFSEFFPPWIKQEFTEY